MILRRKDLLALISHQGNNLEYNLQERDSIPWTGQDIAIIEQNTDLEWVEANKIENSSATWMKRYLGTTQTYVFVSQQGPLPSAHGFEILTNSYREKEENQYLAIKLDNFQTAMPQDKGNWG